jgi:DNA-binding MarR family transcriptional regulator
MQTTYQSTDEALLEPRTAAVFEAERPLSSDALFELLNTLQTVAKSVHARWDQALKSDIPGMTGARAAVLIELARSGDTRQVKLARHFAVSPMTLTRLLDDLEGEGLVQRLPAVDRRTNAVGLTEAGRDKLNAVHTYAHDFLRKDLTGLDETRALILIAALTSLK